MILRVYSSCGDHCACTVSFETTERGRFHPLNLYVGIVGGGVPSLGPACWPGRDPTLWQWLDLYITLGMRIPPIGPIHLPREGEGPTHWKFRCDGRGVKILLTGPICWYEWGISPFRHVCWEIRVNSLGLKMWNVKLLIPILALLSLWILPNELLYLFSVQTVRKCELLTFRSCENSTNQKKKHYFMVWLVNCSSLIILNVIKIESI